MHAVRWLASPRQGEKILLNDFCRAFGHSKAREEKSYFMFLRGRTMFAPTMRVVEAPTPTR